MRSLSLEKAAEHIHPQKVVSHSHPSKYEKRCCTHSDKHVSKRARSASLVHAPSDAKEKNIEAQILNNTEPYTPVLSKFCNLFLAL